MRNPAHIQAHQRATNMGGMNGRVRPRPRAPPMAGGKRNGRPADHMDDSE
jgi:hypothetical protein